MTDRTSPASAGLLFNGGLGLVKVFGRAVASWGEGREPHATHLGSGDLKGPDCGQRGRLETPRCSRGSRSALGALVFLGRQRTSAATFWRHREHVGHLLLAQQRRACCSELGALEASGWQGGVRRLQALVNHRVESLHIEPLRWRTARRSPRSASQFLRVHLLP